MTQESRGDMHFVPDTIFDERLISIAKGVDLLYHEATFLSDKADRKETFHSTASQAATIAKGEVITLKSCGLNPYFLDAAQIADIISKELIPGIPESEKVEHIYFYGAGCGTPEKCEILRAGLAQHFGHGKIHVFSDLLGAAQFLCKNKSWWIGILGTV
ncbi:MAG: hypothetical protein IPL69_20775 [Saprospiraceae bacterium]|nr:hypothetical protein [Candidatus Brachybacter algidus]